MKEFKAISKWLPVEPSYIQPDEMSFHYEGAEYFTSEFLKIHGSPWIDDSEYPDYIRAAGQTSTGRTIYLAIDSYSDYVMVYEEVKGQNR